MEVIYNAEHTFRFRLDQPVVVKQWPDDNGHEVDTIRFEFMWVNEDEEGPAGWWINTGLYGWPLTTRGARDKRTKDREQVPSFYGLLTYPDELRPLVDEAWQAALYRAGITQAKVVNPDAGLLDPRRWKDVQ